MGYKLQGMAKSSTAYIFLLLISFGWICSQAQSPSLSRLKELCYTDFDAAITLADSVIDLKSFNELEKAEALKYKGIAYYFKGSYDKANEAYYTALSRFEDLNSAEGQARVLNELGTLQKRMQKLEEAEKSFLKAQDLAKQGNDSLSLASAYNNLGLIYSGKEQWDKAISLFRKSSKIKKQLKLWNDLSYDLNNLSYAYLAKKDFASAIELMEQSLALRREAGNKRALAISVNNLGEIQLQAGNTELARKLFEEALEKSREISFADLETHVLKMLSETEEKEGNQSKALAYFKEYHQLNDSLLNLAKTKQVEEIETRYETQKKDQEIEILNKDNALKASTIRQNYSLIASLCLLILLLGSLFYLWRQRSQAQAENALQMAKVAAQKEQIKAVFQSQEKERQRIASEVHDGLGQLTAALKLQLQKWKEPLESNDKVQAESTVEELRNEIKNLSHQLLPNSLLHSGLEAALEKWTERLNQTGKIHIHLSCHELPELDKQVELHLYRITQEWVSNILSYNEAKNIYLQLVQHPDALVLTIEDDGFGFDPEHFTKGSGNGYQTLLSRLEIIQGHFHLDSQPGGRGSHFELNLPNKNN